MVLRLILLWNPGAIGISSETAQIIKRASERALEELNIYLKIHKISELQNRLGAVLLLLSPLAVTFSYFCCAKKLNCFIYMIGFKKT